MINTENAQAASGEREVVALDGESLADGWHESIMFNGGVPGDFARKDQSLKKMFPKAFQKGRNKKTPYDDPWAWNWKEEEQKK